MRRHAKLVVPIALLLLPVIGHAQEDGRAATLRDGQRSLAFQVGGSGGSIGYWTMISDRTNLGIDLTLMLNDGEFPPDNHRTAWTIAVGPALKRYLPWDTGPVAPFYYGGAFAGWNRQRFSNITVHAVSATLRGGFGAEWFPARRFSIGGYVGGLARYMHSRREDDFGGTPDSGSDFLLGTFSSGLMFHVYFGGADGAGGPGVATGSR